MNAKSFHLSTQGASHIKKNKACQDASTSFFDESIAIAIVCDGHGGDDYVRSAFGARFACDIAEGNIIDFVNNVDKDELKRHNKQLINNLEASIISGWNEAIYAHYKQNPFSDQEIATISSRAKKKYLQDDRIESAYGTTLIAVAITPDYWFGIHIGDGKCVAVNPEGNFLQPIPWDEKCFLNATTSICDTNALGNFRHFYSEKLPVAVFVGSDGIDDCFNNNEQLNNLYNTVLYSFATSEFDSAIDGLKDYLPRLSAKGSGDDVSIAGVLDFDMICELKTVKEFDAEKERAKVEERARMEATALEAERKRIEEERAAKSKPQPTANHCVNCGAKLIPGMRFCGVCGYQITHVPSVQTPPVSDVIEQASDISETLIISESDSQSVVEDSDVLTKPMSHAPIHGENDYVEVSDQGAKAGEASITGTEEVNSVEVVLEDSPVIPPITDTLADAANINDL